MSSCPATPYNFNCSAATLVNAAQQEITSNGGTFNGNTSSGEFSISITIVGTIAGNYTISGQVITITITQKPFLISCSSIQTHIQEYINGLS